jgi:hypothetical protein
MDAQFVLLERCPNRLGRKNERNPVLNTHATEQDEAGGKSNDDGEHAT